VKREFCEKYGGVFTKMLEDERFQGLGSRSDCGCRQSDADISIARTYR
jgi:hypothetical protein